MTQDSIHLPAPVTAGGISLAQALRQRRSVRTFGPGQLSLAQLGQLLWAAQGITSSDDLRSAPSAGALFPLEMQLAIGAVEGLMPGVYRYLPHQHRLAQTQAGDVRDTLAAAARHQTWVLEAAVVLACGAIYARTTAKYGDRGIRYVHIEVGHVAQNVLLQATALGLNSVMVGAFDDTAVHQALGFPAGCTVLCLIPIGR